jgi:toxin ParE1/3/4
MVKVVFTLQAIADIDEIATYISHDSIHYAALQVKKFFKKTEILEEHPLAGRIVPETGIKSIRELIEGNYRIIYKIVSKESIHVITVHHSRKLLKSNSIKSIIRKNK